MKTITNNLISDELFYSKPLILLFGNTSCKVCDAVKIKLQIVVEEKIPQAELLYIDTMENASLSAKFNIFTAPVVLFTLHGKEYHRWVRSFSIAEIAMACNRIIQLSNTDMK